MAGWLSTLCLNALRGQFEISGTGKTGDDERDHGIRRAAEPLVVGVVISSPFFQLIDAETRGFAADKLVVVLTEVDSSSRDVRAVDERVLSELRRHYPDATDL